jgi:hypothetical protein
MPRRNQLILIFHGSLLMLISMTVESPGMIYALNHGTDDLIRQYLRQAHSVLMVTSVWMIATAMTLPFLQFAGKFIPMLVWSLVITAYSFMLAIAVFIVGLWRYHPDPIKFRHQIDQLKALPPIFYWINISLLVVSGATSLLAGGLLVRGSYNAMRESILEQVH